MSILLLTEVFPPRTGGSGRWFWELYRRLSDLHIHVVAGDVAGAALFDRSANLPISRLPLTFSNWGVRHWRGGPQYARALFGLSRIVSRMRPDAVHCGKCLPEGLLALGIKTWSATPFITFVHGEELNLARTSRELRRLTGRVLRAAAKVIANSHHTKGMLLDEWAVPDTQVVVLHPGVDTARFVPAPPSDEVRSRLGWTNRRVILTVGALQKRKGQDMLIRALPAVRARCPDVLYSIVGEPWERAYLDTVVAESHAADLVQFRGIPADEELIDCYQQCDLFALANRRIGWDDEGFGMVLLEAQACGKPVIAGRSGGTPETIQASRTGELVSSDAPDMLADTISALLEDPARRARMGACARRWVVEQFDWENLSRQARAVFAAR